MRTSCPPCFREAGSCFYKIRPVIGKKRVEDCKNVRKTLSLSDEMLRVRVHN